MTRFISGDKVTAIRGVHGGGPGIDVAPDTEGIVESSVGVTKEGPKYVVMFQGVKCGHNMWADEMRLVGEGLFVQFERVLLHYRFVPEPVDPADADPEDGETLRWRRDDIGIEYGGGIFACAFGLDAGPGVTNIGVSGRDGPAMLEQIISWWLGRKP